MNPLISEIIAFVTSLLSTGSASITLPAQNFDVAGEKFQADETITLKKV